MNQALRIFFRVEKVGRIPHVGNVGFTYVTPIIQRDVALLKDAAQNSNSRKGVSNARTPGNLLGFTHSPYRRYYSTSVTTTDVAKADADRGAPKKKPKTVESPKILLISETHAKSAVTLEEAMKIAGRKGLHLVPVENKVQERALTEKAVYKLVTNAEFLAQENKDSSNSRNDKSHHSSSNDDKKTKEKEVKSMMLKSSIAEHDILSKVKNIRKMVEKGHTVRVMIGQPGDKGNSEGVYKTIETSLKDTGIRFIQKVVKNNQIRFQLMPPKDQPPNPNASTKNVKSNKTAQPDELIDNIPPA